ncbi:MAG: sodium:solute symporter [Rhodospirillales bacterium RIFCSPLOWO2_12_FULL_58_28]|nr:MAG: sodium:solute symporter [Rhodospirillales bacterium RIFCSPLOWO2_02_FULL_58_16]OHC78042.1 MAG: sodium:solute symporter [Rhodospirillales bacterium RIFCSPLOWO2_12_FULL_58_28]
MSAKATWLFVFVALYWAYCVFWGIKCARTAKTAADYFISGRQTPTWAFVLAATAISFSGWVFIDHPGMIYRDGFPYAYASFCAIAIPFTGVLFFKRQWMLGKRFGYVTPGEMLADYFRGDAVRILTVGVALLFSIPCLGVLLRASGLLFNVLTDGLISANVGMWALSVSVIIYVVLGGLRAVTYVGALQCVLLGLGVIIIGMIALDHIGGWNALQNGLAGLAASDLGKWGATKGLGGGDYNAYFAMPGVIQFTAGLGKETPTGGLWTGVMGLTFLFALMGVQSSPAFTMWAFSGNNPKPFAPQQVWASSFGIGFILFLFAAVQGIGAHLLGADAAVTEAGLALGNALPDLTADKHGALVAHYINSVGKSSLWLVGLLAVCALAALQAASASHMSTTGGILTRDLYKRYLSPTASHKAQKLFGRISVILIAASALTTAACFTDNPVFLGGMAAAFGLQMWPSLAAATYFPQLTRQGVTLGLIAGILGVIFTESLGVSIAGFFGVDLAWGRWPWTVHSAVWGIIMNLAVCLPVSAMTQNNSERAHRMKFHNFLAENAGLPAEKHGLKPIAWIITLGWLFFGVGPGAVIGNDIFGSPNAGAVKAWTFGMPSIWAWQIVFWILGVGMMWFLAYKMEMSTMPRKKVEALGEDIGL